MRVVAQPISNDVVSALEKRSPFIVQCEVSIANPVVVDPAKIADQQL